MKVRQEEIKKSPPKIEWTGFQIIAAEGNIEVASGQAEAPASLPRQVWAEVKDETEWG
jgi:hypothetical protein